MGEYPPRIYEIAKEAAGLYPEDIDTAVEKAYYDFVRLPDCERHTEQIIKISLRRLIHEYRHSYNRSSKRRSMEARQMSRAPANPANSKLVSNIYTNILGFKIAGKVLGSILGSELSGIMEAERGNADGHLRNVALCEKLIPLVPQNKTVQQAVSKRTLLKIWGSV